MRIDDLDTARVRPGSVASILKTLTSCGLEWDGGLVYQSQRLARYTAAFEQLRRQGRVFLCDCTRREIRAQVEHGDESPCVGDCRHRRVAVPAASRLDLTGLATMSFHDRWQTVAAAANLPRDLVLLRRDNVFTYPFAVVLDDYDAGVTDVVRGADLMSATGLQLALHTVLNLAPPSYAHVPLITEPDGTKLAKSAHSLALNTSAGAARELRRALALLQQPLPADLDRVQVKELLAHAIRHWNPAVFRGRATIALA